MATIGLDKLYYAKITEDASGNETYGDPQPLAKAMTAELSVELAEATLYADDGAAAVVKEFQSGTLTLGVDDIGVTVAQDLTGATIDGNKVLVSTSEDGGTPVAVGFPFFPGHKGPPFFRVQGFSLESRVAQSAANYKGRSPQNGPLPQAGFS